MTQPFKIKISTDGQKKRAKYKDMESIAKNDAWVMSDKIEDWMFSKVRDHKKFKALF